jgi:hypothetical protein
LEFFSSFVKKKVVMEDLQRLYPIGIQTFSKIREGNFLYVDKTEYVYRMTHSASSYMFLSHPRRLSPPAFRYQLTERARKANKRIVLPEGEEPRTIKAAAICAERGIARPVLLGNPDEIRRVAEQQGVVLTDVVEIIDPAEARERYVPRLVELRKSKGITEVVAREQLEDNVVLGTLMLERNEVDGLVSGAGNNFSDTFALTQFYQTWHITLTRFSRIDDFNDIGQYHTLLFCNTTNLIRVT